MIIGVGTDMVEISRIGKACERQAFVNRVYTEEERRQAGKRVSRLAGDFAVKEAVAKSLGTGFRRFLPGDVEALRDGLGKPYVNLYGEARAEAARLGIGRFHVSITNTGDYAAAFVVAEAGEQPGPGRPEEPGERTGPVEPEKPAVRTGPGKSEGPGEQTGPVESEDPEK